MQEEFAEFNNTPEEAETFLNANVELAKTWILKHVPRRILEAWVAEKRLTVRGGEAHAIHIREKGESRVGGSIFEQAHANISSFYAKTFDCFESYPSLPDMSFLYSKYVVYQ